MTLCKVVDMNGHLLFPVEERTETQLTPLMELLVDLRKPYPNFGELEATISKKYNITKNDKA